MSETNEKFILVINAGSSSVKVVMYSASSLTESSRFSVEGIKQSETYLFDATGHKAIQAQDHNQALKIILDQIAKSIPLDEIAAVGYRVVFSGPNFKEATELTDDAIGELHAYSSYDPDHMPQILSVINTLKQRLPQPRHIACFDTAFFADLPRVARLLPIPHEYQSKGIVAYGYHGLSYTHILQALSEQDPELAEGRIVLAHLGSGASLAAVKDGKPIDTTMSFSPTSGIPMSTRSGDLDPGVASFLMEHEKLDAKSFNKLINKQSGLLGISGLSADMYTLLQNEKVNERAADAVNKFCYEAKKAISSLAATVGGIDGLVFTGGIGERSAAVRDRICNGLDFLGIELDKDKNTAGGQIISKDGTITIRVMHTDEELVIAHQTKGLISK